MTPTSEHTAASTEGPAVPVVTVIGEALIDMVPGASAGDFRALPGGSPFNVAVGLARLGCRTSLMARLADNAFGRLLRGHAEGEGIDLSRAPHATEPTSLAIVSLNEHAQAHYDFYLDGTADWQWSTDETSELPAATAVLHHGSLASWTSPGDDRIHALTSRLYADGQVLISYDPNIRPLLLSDPAKARPLIERCITRTHLVKASSEDVAWLYPDSSVEAVGQYWLSLGALLVVITDGPDGAYLFRSGELTLSRPGRKVAVADTVGAGDSFTAAFLDALVRHDLHHPNRLRDADPASLAHAVDDAVLVSSLTCERIGADPPYLVRQPRTDHRAPLVPADLRFRDVI